MLRSGSGRCLAVVALVLLAVLSSPLWLRGGRAAADPPVGPCANSSVCVGASTPASPPSGGGGSGGGGGGGVQVCNWQGVSVPCSGPYGTFDPADGCYYMEAQPQPPAGDPSWQGHQPGDGAVYTRTCPYQGGAGAANVWLAQAPAAPLTITPGQLAYKTVNTMGLKPATVHTRPDGGGKKTGLVGSPIWLWVDGGDHAYAGPDKKLHVSASVPGLTVTATVWVSKLVWDMGDGGTANCSGPGTAYTNADGANASPDCGYRYTKPSASQPGQQYAITATAHWTVTWVSGNLTGAFDMDPIATPAATLRISELQVLN